MAELDHQVLGKIRGKLGNIVFRKMNGKTVLSFRPEKYKPTKSKKAKKIRAKFGTTVSFAKFINSAPALKEVWANADIPGTNAYQKLIKYNLKLTDESNLTLNNIITPPGISIIVKDIFLDNNKKILSISFQSTNNTQIFSVPYEVHLLLYFYEPDTDNENQYIFDYKVIYISSNSGENLYSLKLNLNNKQISLFKRYKKQIIYTAVIKNSSHKKAIYWSSTFASSLAK